MSLTLEQKPFVLDSNKPSSTLSASNVKFDLQYANLSERGE